MSYRVGQVLYVILRKEASVYPMQVVEEISKKTLEGEFTTYMVRAGADVNKVLAITEIDGEIFDSAEKAKNTLVERVSNSISLRVENAIAKAKEWYPTGFEHAIDDPMSIIKKTSPGQEPKPVKSRQLKPEMAQLAAEFAQEAEDATVMEIPDGNGGMITAKVKSVKVPPTLQS